MGGQVDHVQGYSIIDYVDNRAKEISYSKLCLLPEECFEISLVS